MRARVFPRWGLLSFTLLALAACGGRARTPGGGGSRADAGPSGGADGGQVVSGPCATGADCAAGVCDRILGRCVECRTSAECEGATRCESGRCVASPTCESDLDCTPNGLVCDQAGGRCVACNSAADCADQACLGGSCVDNPACTSSLECADLRMVCGPAAPPAWPERYMGQGCVECVGAADCGDKEACRGGFCEDACGDRICGMVDGASCGACAAGALCSAEGKACLTPLTAQFEAEGAIYADGQVFVWRDGRSSGAATVWSVDVSGSGMQTVRFTSLEGAYLDGVAVAGGRVFAALTDGRIVAAPTAQGILQTFAMVPGVPQSESVWCQGLAGHSAYLVCDLVDYDDAVTDGLYRFPVDGGAPALIDTIVQPSGLFVSGEDVVWSDFNNGQIGKSGLLTGQRTVLDRVQADLRGVAGGYVYYETTGGEQRRAPVGGGAAETLFGGSRDYRVIGFGASRLFLVDTSSEDLVLYTSGLDGANPAPLFEVSSGSLPISQFEVLGVFEHGGALYAVASYGILKIER